MTAPLYGGGEQPLVVGAGAGHPAGDDFSPLIQKAAQKPVILIVDELRPFFAEAAGPFPPYSFFI